MITDALYQEILLYCQTRVKIKKVDDFLNYVDLAHDVIADKEFHVETYKIIVDRFLYSELKIKRDNVEYSDFSPIKDFVVEELWRCKNCEKEQPKSKFQSSWELCNKCYYHKNKERIRKINLKSYYKHHEKRKAEKRLYDKKIREENRKAVRERERLYYAENKERILLKNKRSYLKNRDKRLQYLKEYYHKNKK